jgi:hypothetical protein
MYAWAALLGFGAVLLSFSGRGVLMIGGLVVALIAIIAVSALPRLRTLRHRP